MSEDAQLKRYEVEVYGTFTLWVDVEAGDETEAQDEAINAARAASVIEWTDDGNYTVESTTAVAS